MRERDFPFPAHSYASSINLCEISDDAGVYVCNALLYGMLEHNGGAVPTVFIHVPYSSEQGHADKPFMEQDDIYRAVSAALGSVAMGIIESRATAD